MYRTQGLGFLNSIKDIWSEHDAKNSGQIKEELWKWLQLLLELIDVTLGQAIKQLEIIIRGKGVAKECSKNINKRVSFFAFLLLLVVFVFFLGCCFSQGEIFAIDNPEVCPTI